MIQWTAARFLGPWEFSRWEYWSGLPRPSPGDLPNTGIKPRSPALQADSSPSEPPRKPMTLYYLQITVPSPTPNLLVLTAAIKRLALSLIIHILQIICLFSLVCFRGFSLFHICQLYHVSRPGFSLGWRQQETQGGRKAPRQRAKASVACALGYQPALTSAAALPRLPHGGRGWAQSSP